MLEYWSTGVLGRNDYRKSLDSMRQNAFDGLPLSPMAQRAYPHYSNSPSLLHSMGCYWMQFDAGALSLYATQWSYARNQF